MMPSYKNLNISKTTDEVRDFHILEELDKNPLITQRELSKKFNIALGVINVCIKRMVRKGWIRIRDLNRRKIEYCLTPKGFEEKARLTLKLITATIQHYLELKKIISQRFLEIQDAGIKRIVFYGVSDEMEVAYITIQGTNLKLVGIIEDDEKYQPLIIFGFEVEPIGRIRELKPECIMITTLEGKDKKKGKLQKLIDIENVFISDI